MVGLFFCAFRAPGAQGFGARAVAFSSPCRDCQCGLLR